MYREHNPIIGAYGRASADNMARVLSFVQLTIQQPLYRVVSDIETIHAKNPPVEELHNILWGFKAEAVQFIRDNKSMIYADLMDYWNNEAADYHALEYVARMPGFGFVKSGFVSQLLFGRAGCLDTHNMARFNIPASRYKKQTRGHRAIKHNTMRKHAKAYLAHCEKLGGCEYLWDTWCEYVAEKQPRSYHSAHHVSELHVTAITGE